MYVDWEYYKIFYYVAKYQNFTRAARVLGNNQPNITHAMNRLESQLNCVLFIRSNRGVTLTPEGELLYSRIASAAVQIQDAEEELSATATLEHGAISISTTETALNIYLSEKLRAFHTEYPGIRLRISNHSTPQAVQAVRNGEVDFAIVTTPAEVENGLKMVELMSFYEVLVGGRTFTALASQTLNLKELGVKKVICKAQSHVHRKVLEKIGADRVVFPEHEMGVKLAQGLSSSNVLNFIELSEDFGIVETAIPREWQQKTIQELDVRARYKVNIIAMRKGKSGELNIAPGPAYVMESGDDAVVLGRTEDINRLQDL